MGAVPPLLPRIAEAFALSEVGAAWAVSVFGLARLAVDLPAGYLADRLGRRRCFVAAGAAMTAGTLTCALAPGEGLFYLGRALGGAGHGGAVLMLLLAVLASTPAGARSRAGSLLEGAIIVSFLGSALAVGPIAEAYGWRGAFGLVAAAGLGSTLLGARLRAWKASPAGEGGGSRAGATASRSGRAPSGAEGGAAPPATVARVLPLYAAAFSIAFTWAGLLLTLVPLAAAARLGLGATDIGRVLSLAYASDLALLLPVALVADRLGGRGLLVAALAVAAAFAPLVLLASSAGWLAAGVAVLGGTFAVWILPATLLMRAVPPSSHARTIGVYRFVIDLAFIGGPLALAWTARAGGPSAAAALAAAVPCVALLALVGSPRGGR